jgi:predicted dehydrogenase
MADALKIGIIGAGRWAQKAHLPGFTRSPLSEVVAICDLDRKKATERAAEFKIPNVVTDYKDLLKQKEIDVIDICTRASPGDPDNHERLVFETLKADKHCLCEKPVAHNFRNTWKAHRLATKKELKTKVGFTFRYAPAMMYMNELIEHGFIGTPFIFNGFEQNSQFIDLDEPLTKRDLIPAADSGIINVSSLEGYGAPIIDLSLWFMKSNLSRVVGLLKNFIPYRTDYDGTRVRTHIDDGDIYIGEFANGAFCTIQSSYVTVGNYPGLEARAYGSEGALICRLVEEFGVYQTLHKATPDAVEFVPVTIPERYFPPGYVVGESWPSVFYSNLVHNFMEEITAGGDENQGNFSQSARVQEIINAVELSHLKKKWIELPLDQ